MMKKKVLGLLAVCCICAITGCAGGNTAGNKESQKTEATETKTTEAKVTEASEETTEEKATEASEKATEAKTTEETTDAKATEVAETEVKEAETAATGATESATEVSETGVSESAAEEAAPNSDKTWETYTSEMGYSLQYDSSAFTVEHMEDADVFTYQKAENAAAPISLSVQKYSDMDAATVANGLALQAGTDETMVLDTNIGAEGRAAKYVYAQKDVEDVTQMQAFYVVSQGEGSLVIEICSYIGAPEGVDGNFENMMGTFSCIEGERD